MTIIDSIIVIHTCLLLKNVPYPYGNDHLCKIFYLCDRHGARRQAILNAADRQAILNVDTFCSTDIQKKKCDHSLALICQETAKLVI